MFKMFRPISGWRIACWPALVRRYP